jgi:sterol desaturase/sphingolipid hydroxylase (fatty acid hydroxylase superfamily)
MMRNTRSALPVAAIGAIAPAKRRSPLRPATRPASERSIRNLGMGSMWAAVVALTEAQVTQAVACAKARDRRGLTGCPPAALGPIVVFLATDYGFYRWHVATHIVPLLWRLHRVHHVDRDMEMSTALCFHFVGMAVSLPWHSAQVRLIGIGPRTLAVRINFFFVSILLHDASLRLLGRWGDWTALILTTPRMHGIHHSQRLAEQDSNGSRSFSLWEQLDGTLVVGTEQASIPTGVADVYAEAEIALGRALVAPFA